MEVHKKGMGLSFFSSAKLNIIGKESTVMESFIDYLLCFFPHLCFTYLGRHAAVSNVSLHGLCQFVMSVFDGDHELQLRTCVTSELQLMKMD